MNPAEIVAELAELDVELWAEHDRLRYRAARGVMTPQLLNRLRDHKAEILAHLARTAGKAQDTNRPRADYPLSYGQQALWYIQRSAPHITAYNIAQAARIRSPLVMDALRGAFQILIARHQSLRAIFPVRDGQPVQQIHPGWDHWFQQVDATQWNWDQVLEQVNEVCRHPFNLEHGPLFRVHVFTRAADDHILLFAAHHITCDGWSLSLLQYEFQLFYQQIAANRPVSLESSRKSYGDFIDWQKEMLAGDDGERHWSYWRQELGGRPPVLELSPRRARRRSNLHSGDVLPLEINGVMTSRLKTLARAEGVTLYILLLAAYQVLLHRISQQEEIWVGSPAVGRTRPEFADVVGYFVNPIVLRANLSGNPVFRDFLAAVRRKVLAALEHQDFPFGLLVERLQPPRVAGQTPLFQASFALQQPHHTGMLNDLLPQTGLPQTVEWGGLRLEPFPIKLQEGQFEITLDLVEGRRSIIGEFRYRTALFDAPMMERLRRHFIQLLESIVENPGERVQMLPLLAPSERQILLEWGRGRPAASAGRLTVHELFAEQARKSPERRALQFGDESWNYQELNERANRLAHLLRAQGIGPEKKVGILLPRSLDLIAAVLAVLKAGGAYVPCDPSLPRQRLAFILEDSGAVLLLTRQDHLDKLPSQSPPAICIDMSDDQFSRQPATDPERETSPDHLAYVIYTSGSTGRPKGVALEHRGLANLILALVEPRHFDLTADDRMLQFSSIGFDASVPEIFGPLCVGATVCLITSGEMLPGPGLLAALHRYQITNIILPPSVLAQLPADELPHLRTLIVAGERCTQEIVDRWGRGRRFINAYGPTECTVCTSMAECRPHNEDCSIGVPIDNVCAYVLDEHLQLTPVGVPGELCIGGEGLARGYLNLPELTQARFIPDPFASNPSARLYKTGDRCRWRSDGKLEYLDRIDDQVKVNGHRIELGEVETALARHPQVRQCAVTIRETNFGERDLVGYIVCTNGITPPACELRGFLEQSLPGYMLPSAYVTLDSLPTNVNHKVDRSALPEPSVERPELERPFAPPRTRLEQELAEIWSEVLGISPVGIHDDFFALGGASMKSLRIVAKMQQTVLQTDAKWMTPELLFEHPTIAELAERIATTGQLDGSQSRTS